MTTSTPTTRVRASASSSRGLRRSHVVWATLVASMTVVGGLLLASEGNPRPADLPAAASLSGVVEGRSVAAALQTRVEIDDERWVGIVIHHSGSVSGSPASIGREQEAQGLRGLGYHFVISNGRGSSDGEIHVGYRWSDQLAGAHTVGPDADWYNRHTIGICLVGDGDQRGFSELQLRRLVELVDALKGELGIDDRRVFLHRDVASTSSPGRLFPEGAFRASLASVH